MKEKMKQNPPKSEVKRMINDAAKREEKKDRKEDEKKYEKKRK